MTRPLAILIAKWRLQPIDVRIAEQSLTFLFDLNLRLSRKFPPQPVIVTEYKIAHYICPCCRKEVVARDANCPHEGKFGNNVIAQATLMNTKIGCLTERFRIH